MSANVPPSTEELVERLEDWARVLDRAPAFLAKGQYSRIYEATFRTAADIREYVARLKPAGAARRTPKPEPEPAHRLAIRIARRACSGQYGEGQIAYEIEEAIREARRGF